MSCKNTRTIRKWKQFSYLEKSTESIEWERRIFMTLDTETLTKLKGTQKSYYQGAGRLGWSTLKIWMKGLEGRRAPALFKSFRRMLLICPSKSFLLDHSEGKTLTFIINYSFFFFFLEGLGIKQILTWLLKERMKNQLMDC